MVLKFVMYSEEVEDFVREIHIDSDATFLDFHDAILESVGYGNDQLTSFYLCDDDWERGAEIAQIMMDTSSDEDCYVMENTRLEEFIDDEGQKLMFVYDIMNERSFFIELKEIKTGCSLGKPLCKTSKGKAPNQLVDGYFLDDFSTGKMGGSSDYDMSDDFLDTGFSDDELDGLSINDNYFEDQQ